MMIVKNCEQGCRAVSYTHLDVYKRQLVILDLNLPEISGFQICQELTNKTAIPVLVLTSRDQVKDELQAFHLGADEYLTCLLYTSLCRQCKGRR